MRLVNIDTMRLDEFHDETCVKYAILSHRWEGQELTFKDKLKNCRNPAKRMSYLKLSKCCDQARRDGLSYVWIDTCCIDKSSSAELQEAINSMFRWYSNAVVCYAYLSDVQCSDNDDGPPEQLEQSLWFTRGWTLQELVAPNEVIFFDSAWKAFGTRKEMAEKLYHITGIERSILDDGFPYSPDAERPAVCDIMSWAKGRKTTRIEDRAYSLLGLFNVNMAMLYGEGEKAFTRLQEEIIRATNDPTILAWENTSCQPPSCLARSPDQYTSPLIQNLDLNGCSSWYPSSPVISTSQGVSLHAVLVPWRPGVYLAILDGSLRDSAGKYIASCGIYLVPLSNDKQYARAAAPYTKVWTGHFFPTQGTVPVKPKMEELIIVRRLSPSAQDYWLHGPLSTLGFDVALSGCRPSMTTVYYPKERTANFEPRFTEVQLEECWQRKTFTRPDTLGPVVKFSILRPGGFPRLYIRLGFWDNFNPFVMVEFKDRYVFEGDHHIELELSEWVELTLFGDLPEGRSGSRLQLYNLNVGEVCFRDFKNPDDEQIWFRGIDPGPASDPWLHHAIDAQIKVRAGDTHDILSFDIAQAISFDDGEPWRCSIVCRSESEERLIALSPSI